jgi:hypothetical protein
MRIKKEDAMKKIIVMMSVVCLVLVGFAEKAAAGAVPLSAQESAQLNELAGNDALLTLKAGGAFPDAPKAMEATEESTLRHLEAGSPDLSKLKAGDETGSILIAVILVCVCIILVRAVL